MLTWRLLKQQRERQEQPRMQQVPQRERRHRLQQQKQPPQRERQVLQERGQRREREQERASALPSCHRQPKRLQQSGKR